MNNAFKLNQRSSLPRHYGRNISPIKRSPYDNIVKLESLYSAAKGASHVIQGPHSALARAESKDSHNNSGISSRNPLQGRYEKPYLPEKLIALPKKAVKLEPLHKYDDQVLLGKSSVRKETGKNKVGSITATDSNQTMLPSMVTVIDNNQASRSPLSMVNGVDLSDFKKKIQSLPETRRYHSVGRNFSELIDGGGNKSFNYVSNFSMQTNSQNSFEREGYGYRHYDFGRKTSNENQEEAKKIKETVQELQDRHSSFMKSMKILKSLTSEVDLSHDHLINCIQKYPSLVTNEGKAHSSDSQRAEGYREILLQELDKFLEHKMKCRPLNGKMQKENIEEFGGKMTMYLKKIEEELIKQGNKESAIMLSTLNKILALELEEIFASYVIQVERIKQNPEKELISELMKERGKNKMLNAMMKLKRGLFKEAKTDIQSKLQNYKKERDDFEEQLKKQEVLIQSLLKQIKRGLTKPLVINRQRSKRRRKNKGDRRFSLDLEAVGAQDECN